MSGRNVGYIYLGNSNPNTATQLEGVPLDAVFTEHGTGRKQLWELQRYVLPGDTVHIQSLDRLPLPRELAKTKAFIRNLTRRGIEVRFLTEGLTFTAGIADEQIDALTYRHRHRDGMRRASRRGVLKGSHLALTNEQANTLRERIAAGETKAALAREYGLSRETVYQYLRRDPQLEADE